MKKWKIKSQKTLVDHKFIKVVENQVVLPNGVELTYITTPSEHDSAAVIALDSDGRVLVQKQYNLGPDEVLYELPGGGIDKDEDTAAGAKRELEEETGVLAAKLTYLGDFFPNNRRSNQKQYVYLAEDLTANSAQPEPGEIIESRWVSVQELDDMIGTGEIKNMNMLAAWALFGSYRARQ